MQGAPACSRLWGHTREGARPHCSGVACTATSLQAVGLLDPQQLRRGLRPARSSCGFHGASRAPSGQEPIRALSSPAAARSEGTPDGPGNPAKATRERPPADIWESSGLPTSGPQHALHLSPTARRVQTSRHRAHAASPPRTPGSERLHPSAVDGLGGQRPSVSACLRAGSPGAVCPSPRVWSDTLGTTSMLLPNPERWLSQQGRALHAPSIHGGPEGSA